jgi:catechol 2,3-dioxygenase-like lactoylglutathione lyase family enzyme
MADFGTGARPVVQLGDDAPATPPQATEPEPVGSESAGLESLAPESGPRRTGGATLEFILRESEPAPPPPPRYSDEVERPPNANGAVAQFLPVGSTGPLAAPAGSVAGINGVSVTLIVADLERSRRFYRDIIGMDEVDSSAQTSVLAFGDAGVVLRQVSDMAPVDRRVMHLNLEVADVTRAYERLHARGVEFVHKPRVVAQGEQLELCSAMFRDPDGHAVTLMRWEIRR